MELILLWPPMGTLYPIEAGLTTNRTFVEGTCVIVPLKGIHCDIAGRITGRFTGDKGRRRVPRIGLSPDLVLSILFILPGFRVNIWSEKLRHTTENLSRMQIKALIPRQRNKDLGLDWAGRRFALESKSGLQQRCLMLSIECSRTSRQGNLSEYRRVTYIYVRTDVYDRTW